MSLSNMTSSEMPPLEYGCSKWRKSSQTASNLFNAGCKLWTKTDLRDIEQQLTRSETQENFTVRSIDGSTVRIKNPMFGEPNPIWKPIVVYQEYWRLIKAQPDRVPATYHCSYLPDWNNTAGRDFRGVIDNSDSIFEEKRLAWNQSTSCKSLRSQLEHMPIIKKASKIVCFGLGDFCQIPAEWVMRQSSSALQELEASAKMVQHSVALTIADVCRDSTGIGVRLLAQDPQYTEKGKEILESYGFSIVGDFGAEGFAEIDDNSIVFSVGITAPLKQIIADIARPLLIFSTAFAVFNDAGKPYQDPDSPRTKDMWRDYDRLNLPISLEDEQLVSRLREIYLYVRKAD